MSEAGSRPSRPPRSGRPLLVGWLLVAPLASGAAVVTVTTTVDTLDPPFSSDGQCSLREAIQAANTDTGIDTCAAGAGADTIVVPAGTYELTIVGADEDANQTGDLDVTEDVEIAGEGAQLTILDDSANERILHVHCNAASPAAVSVTLRDLRLTGGRLTIDSGGASGGGAGLYVQDCAFPVHATVERVEVDDNFVQLIDAGPARPGGGIAIDTAGQVTIRDAFVHDNVYFQLESAGSFGGGGIGISGGGSALIVDTWILDNQIDQFGGDDPSGAGIWTDTFTEVRGSTLEGNAIGTSGRGGGMYCEDAVLLVRNSTLVGNRAFSGGGAFGNGIDGAPGCLVTFDSVTIAGNLGNIAAGILNDTGGVGVTNSIVAGNVDLGGNSLDVSGAFTSGDYNLVGAVDGSTGFTEPNDLTGTSASPLDPLLGSLGAEGFAAPTRSPLPGSPALDSGGGTSLTVDQRGLPRGFWGFATERGAAEVLGANYGLYVDVGTSAGAPGAGYAAAATAAGAWNSQDIGTAPALERSGASSGATIEIASDSHFGIGAGATDAARLFVDDARDCTSPEAWSVSFDGLPDADYLVLVYAPFQEDRSTGDVLVNGAPLSPLPGDQVDLEEGVSFASVPATVAGGTLVVSGSDGTSPDCAGIAGVQLLPEPRRASGFAAGLVLLVASSAWGRSRRRLPGASQGAPEPRSQ